MQSVVVTIHIAIGLIDRDRLARERSKQKLEAPGALRASPLRPTILRLGTITVLSGI
jgi:hypothetical protein